MAEEAEQLNEDEKGEKGVVIMGHFHRVDDMSMGFELLKKALRQGILQPTPNVPSWTNDLKLLLLEKS